MKFAPSPALTANPAKLREYIRWQAQELAKPIVGAGAVYRIEVKDIKGDQARLYIRTPDKGLAVQVEEAIVAGCEALFGTAGKSYSRRCSSTGHPAQPDGSARGGGPAPGRS